jgi:hypothetical protein
MTSPAPDGQRTIALAAVAGAHGITGELRLKLFANNVASFTKGATMMVGGAPMKLLGIKGTAPPPRNIAAAWSRSSAPHCPGSTRANIISPT